MERIIVGLDLGTSKIKAAVAVINSDGQMKMLGLHDTSSSGVSRGNIVDLAEASSTIEHLMNEIKEKHGSKVHKMVLAIGGVGFSSDRAKASLILHNGPREVNRFDIEKIIHIARNMNFSLERFILHEVIEDYLLDEQKGVKKPIGLFAKKLELDFYTLFHNVAHIQNIVKCIHYAGYDIEKIIFSGLASINCMVNNNELTEGIIFIDIGCETTKIVVAAEDRIRYCNILDIGSADITRSISAKLKISFALAEQLKLDTHVTKNSLAGEKTNIAIGRRKKEILKSDVYDIVEKEIDKLLRMVKKKLDNSSLMDYIKSGIVLAGGGALLDGLPEKIESFFNLPTRRGDVNISPLRIKQPSHLFAPSIGALEHYSKEVIEKSNKFNSKNPLLKLTHKISTFINDYF